MTILTKPFSEKSQDKIPITAADEIAMLHGTAPLPPVLITSGGSGGYGSDVDSESMVFNRPQVSCIKSCLLFLLAVLVMMMGIMGGYTIYRMYSPARSDAHYMCQIPYRMTNISMPQFDEFSEDFDLKRFAASLFNNRKSFDDDDYFHEEIQLDLRDDDGYSKIDVPDFKDGRRGRFMHDFKENQSAIIDTTANRCFIMPLDRSTTLPPKSFLDLMQKMGTGYYNIDTDRVRRHMRVVTPPIKDLSLISERIANECYDSKVYMLENYVSGVFKREAVASSSSGKFAEFSGKGIIEFDIMNIADIDEFERKQQK